MRPGVYLIGPWSYGILGVLGLRGFRRYGGLGMSGAEGDTGKAQGRDILPISMEVFWYFENW